MTGRGDLDLVKAGLQERIREVCQNLLPDGREESGQWVSFNPVTGDRARHGIPALKVRIRGGVAGAWKDWRSGDAGDVLKLVGYLTGADTSGALAWGRDFLGLRAMDRATREAMRKSAATAKVRREKDDDAARRRKLVAAEQLFRAAGGPKDIGPAAVPAGVHRFHVDRRFASQAQIHAEAYFRARKVPLDEIPTLNPMSFYFSAATEYWRGAQYSSEGGRRFKAAAGPLFPAVHAGMRNALGIVTCCHITFLDPMRPEKAPVDQAKLMFGEALGAVIEISTGPAQQPFWLCDREKPYPVVLAEGIETALSWAVAGVPARIWACGSLAGIGAAPVHMPCVDWVLFARDNNDGNPQAQKQFSKALDQLERHGKRIDVRASHVGDDFNDLAKGEA